MQFAAIGRIAVESAYLEELVEFVIREITRLSSGQMTAVFPGVMLSSKLDILRDLGVLKLRSKKKKDEFIKLIGDTVSSPNNWTPWK
jgi:hypothetical protein